MSSEIVKVLIEMIEEEEEIKKYVAKFIREQIKKYVKKDMKTYLKIERKLPRGCHAFQPMGQCASRTYNLLKLAPGQYGLKDQDRVTPQGLPPGKSLPIPLDFTIEVGAVHLTIRADVSSNVPVKLAIHKARGQEIWATQPSTRIAGTYAVDLEAPGTYELRIENPSSNNADACILGTLDVTMCGGPAVRSWPWQHIKSAIKHVALDGAWTPMAPMGIAVYGVKKDGGRYFTYELTTEAVRGEVYIPPDVSVSGYWLDGVYYGQAFSMRLSAIVVVRLIDGTTQYYRIQNIVGFKKGGVLKVWDNIWRNIQRLFRFKENKRPGIWDDIWWIIQRLFKYKRLKVRNYIEDVTTAISTLDESRVRGRGKIYIKLAGPGNYYEYVMPGTIPFGRVELETWVRADDGKIIVEFYANGRKYDEVIITPRVPATSAYIVIAPTTTPTGLPLNLELVFGGYDDYISFAVLNAGQIDLELYVRMNGAWIRPPSAWNVGYATYWGFSAYMNPDVGSVLKPGLLTPLQLW